MKISHSYRENIRTHGDHHTEKIYNEINACNTFLSQKRREFSIGLIASNKSLINTMKKKEGVLLGSLRLMSNRTVIDNKSFFYNNILHLMGFIKIF
jgi:hypothetical protein